jgi:hypothetical protein
MGPTRRLVDLLVISFDVNSLPFQLNGVEKNLAPFEVRKVLENPKYTRQGFLFSRVNNKMFGFRGKSCKSM